MEKYYRLPLQKVLESVESSQKGLTQQQAQQRLHKYGKNVLQESKKKNTFVIFLEQFKDFLVIILIVFSRCRKCYCNICCDYIKCNIRYNTTR